MMPERLLDEDETNDSEVSEEWLNGSDEKSNAINYLHYMRMGEKLID